MRVRLRVKPGASHTRVGGRYGEDQLVVRVTAPAVDGRATAAVLEAVARALDVRRSEVRLVAGATARTKTVEVPDAAEILERVADLLET